MMKETENIHTERSRSILELRFPEFEGEWNSTILGEIAKFSKGKGISKNDINEHGENLCIRYGELYTHYAERIIEIHSKTNCKNGNAVLSKYGDVIIPASGETQIDIAKACCVLKDNIQLGGDLNIIRTSEDGLFLAYYLNNKRKIDIAKLSQGVSVVHLYSSQLALLNLNLPTLPEQQKIASFLTAVDDKINQLSKKAELLEEYKKGVMQKIFSQEIRFKDEDGKEYPEWEEKKLGEVFKFLRGSTFSKSEIVADGQNHCIHYGELFTIYSEVVKTIFSKTDSDGFRSIAGDILMPSSDVTPTGLATASVVMENDVIIGGDVNVLRPKSQIKSVFMSYCLNYYKKKLIRLVTGTTVKHIYNRDVSLLKYKIPVVVDEQQKIASFLTSIDQKIEQVNTQLEKAKIWKKGLLQKMFV
jgi:type I restriction enzyme S subunit